MKKKRKLKGTGPHGMPWNWEALSTDIEISIEVGLITEAQASVIAEFAEDFMRLVVLTNYYSDSLAVEQIQVIHKLIDPDAYELPTAVIKELAKKYQGVPAHNRARELRKIMWKISHALEPVKQGAKNLLDGPVKVRPLASVEWRLGEEAVLHAEVTRHWKPNVTLQSLAIRIYLDELQREGVQGIDAAHLRADLRALGRWEISNRPGFGAAAEPTAPLWRLLSARAGRSVPMDWVKWLKKNRRQGGGES
jgi:hypothetical protein